MALDIYDSQYLLILAPSLVIAFMFLFFWLFMKETSYDEVLAKQKRDLKLPPSKPDSRKKSEKKKSKKKESASGVGGGGGGSEEDLPDFDVADVGSGSVMEAEEEPVVEISPVLSAYVPLSMPPEATAGVRERKKEKKKAAKAAAAAAAAATAAAQSTDEPEVNDSNVISSKTEQPPQSSPPPVQQEVQVQVQAAQAPLQAQAPPPASGKKKEKKKQKAEAGELPVLSTSTFLERNFVFNTGDVSVGNDSYVVIGSDNPGWLFLK